MLIDNFYPLNRTYLFKFASDNCFYCKNGYCIIDKMTNEEIINFNVESTISYHRECDYCLWLAKSFLANAVDKPAWIYKSTTCNHHVFDDGQHRTCVFARLKKRGFDIRFPVEYYESNYRCKYCSIIDKRLREHPFGNIPLLNDAIRNQIKELVYKEYQIVEFSL